MPEIKEVAVPRGLVPAFPGGAIPVPDIAPPPLAIPFGPPGVIPGGGGFGVMTTTFRDNDRFTTRHQEGSLVITVTGKIADGKAKVNEIKVQDGNENNKYESAEKVPEQYRDKVKNLVEMSEKGSVKIEIKKPE